MNTFQVQRELAKEPGFRGVFARDRIPLVRGKDKSLIFNTLPSTSHPDEEGHWIALYFTEDTVEYFDVSGMPPVIKSYLRRCIQPKIVYHNRPIQSPYSVACGMFCIDFIKRRLRGEEFAEIVSSFSNHLLFNDFLVQ